MRLVTWNCCRGTFAKKAALLDCLSADITVIQECGKPELLTDQLLWFGDNHNQGVAIVARGDYKLRELPQLGTAPKFVIPIEVEGPQPFLMLAVWAKVNDGCRYIECVVRAVEAYEHLLRPSQTVLIGDLNSNAIWDRKRSFDLSHSGLVKRLDGLGLVSAYHAYFNEQHGGESNPTFYLNWNEKKPYHIDYCFLPREWMPHVYSVAIGSNHDWRKLSDHRPLLVDLEFPNK